jgi:hypothetical protein
MFMPEVLNPAFFSRQKNTEKGEFFITPFSAPQRLCLFGKSVFGLSWELD